MVRDFGGPPSSRMWGRKRIRGPKIVKYRNCYKYSMNKSFFSSSTIYKKKPKDCLFCIRLDGWDGRTDGQKFLELSKVAIKEKKNSLETAATFSSPIYLWILNSPEFPKEFLFYFIYWWYNKRGTPTSLATPLHWIKHAETHSLCRL